MPELPEVETIRRDLELKIIHQTIKKVTVTKPKLIKSDLRDFIQTLIGNQIIIIDRIGKLLIFSLISGQHLLVHLKMTGQLIYQKGKKIIPGGHSDNVDNFFHLPNKHTHIWFDFSNDSHLFFNDLRQFGYMRLVNDDTLSAIKANFGIDPLSRNFTSLTLYSLLSSRKTSLKAVLLNQKLIAGIGNIYADEACFLAKIDPSRQASKISAAETAVLVKTIKKILKKAIKYRGTTFNDFRDAEGRSGNFLKYLQVYQRHKNNCFQCGQLIQKKKIAGRGTHYCPNCQL